MDRTRSREAAVEFLDYLADKGLMARATASARKAAVNAVLGILDAQEAQDVTSINLDVVMSRFSNLQGKGYTPQSLQTYKSRVKSALDDFASYVKNPLAFKPNVQMRERRSGGKASSNSVGKDSGAPAPEATRHVATAVDGPMANSILHVPIRADLTIHIQGLPFDLTEAEAKKIASVVQAMAMMP
jgi:site-specific recombinase XerC